MSSLGFPSTQAFTGAPCCQGVLLVSSCPVLAHRVSAQRPLCSARTTFPTHALRHATVAFETGTGFPTVTLRLPATAPTVSSGRVVGPEGPPQVFTHCTLSPALRGLSWGLHRPGSQSTSFPKERGRA
jgi:hypothetical protein